MENLNSFCPKAKHNLVCTRWQEKESPAHHFGGTKFPSMVYHRASREASPRAGSNLRATVGLRAPLLSHLRILTCRAPQLWAAAPTPLSAVQQYTPSSLSSTLRMVRSCPFLCMLYRVSNSLWSRVQVVRRLCAYSLETAPWKSIGSTSYFQHLQTRKGTENIKMGLKIQFGPH